MFYLLIKDKRLWNIYQRLPDPTLLDVGISIEQVETLPPGLKIGQVRREDGSWADPEDVFENWQAFIDKLDIPERGGNGGYALALASEAKLDAIAAYNLVILFLRGVARDLERLTLQYHLQQIVQQQPELKPKLQEALVAGRIQLSIE
jgi:hypothetical protein